MRYAIYFTPHAQDALTRRAAAWLGRDVFTGDTTCPPEADGVSSAEIGAHTASARRYGFHATLKAPFRLAEGRDEAGLVAGLEDFCRGATPFAVSLALRHLDGFMALMPDPRSPQLDRLAGQIVRRFDPFRAPLTEREIERRKPERLSPVQLSNLERWGYPYVFEEFRFHMTLTDRIAPDKSDRVERALRDYFNPVLSEPVMIGSLALFVEPQPGAPFEVLSFHEFGSQGSAAKPEKTA